jgi:Flp pilus assembly pilin Flp
MNFFTAGQFLNLDLPLMHHFLPSSGPKSWPYSCKMPLQTNKGASMKQLKNLRKLMKNQKGQGVMEYVIISSLVGIVCITAVKGFGGVIKTRIEHMKEGITKNIE